MPNYSPQWLEEPSTKSVEIELVQKAYADCGLSNYEIARRLGWFKCSPDTQRVRRAVGLCATGGDNKPAERTSYDRAVMMVLEGFGLEPADYGL